MPARPPRPVVSLEFAPPPRPGWLQRPALTHFDAEVAEHEVCDPMQVITFADEGVPLPDAHTTAASRDYIASAARAGNARMLRAHLAAAPRDIVNVQLDNRNTTLLLLAARHAPARHPYYPECNGNEAVHVLLSMGANPNQPDAFGSRPLHAVAQRGPEMYGAFCALLRAGADPSLRHNDGTTVLHAALSLYRRNPVRMIQTLVDFNVDVNRTSHRGQTPLFVAVRTCQKPEGAVDWLLRAGAHPDVESTYTLPATLEDAGTDAGPKAKVVSFGTPLVALAHYCREPLPAMRLLVQAGASLHAARAAWPNVALLDESVRSMDDIEGLFRQLREEKYLREHPVAPDPQPESAFAKKTASSQSMPHVRDQIDAPGVDYDINARDDQGMTALLYGIKHDSQHAVDELLQNGADPTLRGPLTTRKWLMRKKTRHDNALMYAVALGRVGCARSILDWYNRNLQQNINLKKVGEAIEATQDTMMAECFASFKMQRAATFAALNSHGIVDDKQ